MLIKRVLLYIGLAFLVFAISYNLHFYIAASNEVYHPFSLLKVYLFQVIASLLLVISLECLASLTTQFKDQLGFLYLGSMAVKILFFCIVFRDVLFSQVSLSKTDSIALLLPTFIFLFYEVLIIVKILNRSA